MDWSHVIEMSKPATVVIGAASIIALAVIVGVSALRGMRSRPAPHEEPAVAEPAPAEPTAADVKPAPRLVPTLVAQPRVRASAEPDARNRLDETSLLAKLHDLAALDPPLSLKLAREAVD